MNFRENIAKIIKKRRDELGLDQATLKDYAEIGSTTLSNIEQAKANVSIDVLEKILDVLGLELNVKVKEIG